jgi:UDP-N-acetylmuramyl pentapeptide phosphotransferase/UDP-N-acetylglucosamine-1-phosphate transferase
MVVWAVMQAVQGEGQLVVSYLPFLVGLLMVAGVSFWDDVKSLPDSVRLVVQFVAMGLMFWSMNIMHWNMWWIVLIALIVCVGATNVINFMDGINGITAGYSLAVLVPLVLLNQELAFMEPTFLVVAILGVLVFCIFNFRPKGKAKCFAGDVGSIAIAFIMLFAIGKLVVLTGDVTYLISLLVYGVDGCLTICHRIMLHENLGEAHRKHAYQLMANELKIGHVKVSLLYMAMQLVVSLGFIYVCPNTVLAHWVYLLGAVVVLGVVYVLFKKKYYHLHEAYLRQLRIKN